MKKFALIMLCLAMLFSSACASIFSAEYYDSYPFMEQDEDHQDGEQEIRNYAALKSAIMELVRSHTEQASFRFGSYSGSLIDDLASVCVEIKNDDPLGAYAIAEINYDTSRIVSYYTSEISISYRKTAQEIAAVQSVSGLGEFGNYIRRLLDDYGSSGVVRVYSSVVNEAYIEQLVEDYYYADPMLAVLKPTVRVIAYPASGAERIYEISMDYGERRESLISMEEELGLRLEALASSLGEGDSLSLALLCAVQLSNMVNMEEEACSYPGTAYGTLVEGSDESLGLAMSYKALCTRLGVDCYVVRGEYSNGGVADHAWNIISLDGEYYHVDVSRFEQRAFLLSDEDVWGEYYWNKDTYPVCDGSLGPGDVFEPIPEELPTPVPTPDAETQPTPEPDAEPTPETTPEPDEGKNDENGEENIENN